ncbi:SDR family NAD(P)-dependent oxidoreductase [Rhodobacteraceae bacterium]|nr:SDR family NAD(P)-dependent oxidoreductase [Paracoccaceae bacterium]
MPPVPDATDRDRLAKARMARAGGVLTAVSGAGDRARAVQWRPEWIKTALVTGTAGGTRSATAKARAVCRLTRGRATSRKAMMARAWGGVCDVTKGVSVARMVSGITGATGRIDLLVNTAGRARIGAADAPAIDQAKALFDINLFGMLRVTKAVYPVMRTHKGRPDHHSRFRLGRLCRHVQHARHRLRTCG